MKKEKSQAKNQTKSQVKSLRKSMRQEKKEEKKNGVPFFRGIQCHCSILNTGCVYYPLRRDIISKRIRIRCQQL